MDYSDYHEGEWQGERYGVVSHLLSVSLNQRVRLQGVRAKAKTCP